MKYDTFHHLVIHLSNAELSLLVYQIISRGTKKPITISIVNFTIYYLRLACDLYDIMLKYELFSWRYFDSCGMQSLCTKGYIK